MADFDNGDVVRLGCVQKLDLVNDIANVLTVQITSGGGLAFAAAAQDFSEYCGDLFEGMVTLIVDEQLPSSISVANLTQDAVWGNIAWTTYDGGNSTGGPTAAQVAMLVFGRTNISRVQIRKYLGVFSTGFVVNGEWTAGARSVAQTFIDNHITPQTMTNGLVLRGCAYNAALARVTFANSGATSGIPVIQRRRRIGRGS